MLNINCKDCIYSTIARFDKNWKAIEYFCCKKHEIRIADQNIDCESFVHYADEI